MGGYSFSDDIGDGIKTTFPFTFVGPENGYFDLTDIFVEVDGVDKAFTITGPTQVTLLEAPALGASVRIRRIEDVDAPYTDFARGNNFGKQNVNRSFEQQLYVSHQIMDGFKQLGYYEKQDLDMGLNKIGNLADGVSPTDSINLGQMDTRMADNLSYATRAELAADEAEAAEVVAVSSASGAQQSYLDTVAIYGDIAEVQQAVVVSTEQAGIATTKASEAAASALLAEIVGVLHLDSVADLRAYTGESLTLILTGYYTKGDGGGGPLRVWKTGAIGTYVDNGGSIIVPTGGDGSGAWVYPSEGGLNPRHFGAKGLSNNDTDAFIAVRNVLIDPSSNDDTGVFKIPTGTYSLTQNLDFTGLTSVGLPSIEGNGQRTTILNFTGLGDVAALHFGVPFTGLESTGWREISKLRITQSPDNKLSGSGIRWESANAGSALRDLYIRGFGKGVWTRDDWGCRYENLYIRDCGIGMQFERQPNGVFVSGVYLQLCDQGFSIDQPWAITLQSCIVERDKSTSVTIIGGNATIRGCYFEGALAGHTTTINIIGQGGERAPVVTVEDSLFNNNPGNSYVDVTSARTLVVRNNTISTPNEANKPLVRNPDPISFGGVEYLEITGNVVRYTPEISTDTVRAFITPLIGDGMIRPGEWRKNLVIGSNGVWTQRGTILPGTSNLSKISNTDVYADPTLAANHITDARTHTIGSRFWNPLDSVYTVSTNQGDAGTFTAGVTEDGLVCTSLLHGGVSSWAKVNAWKSIDLTYLKSLFGTNATLAIHVACFCKKGRVAVRRRTGATVAGLSNGNIVGAEWGWSELIYKVKLDLNTTLDIGISVSFADGTGYFAPVDAMIVGLADWYDYARKVSY